MSSPLVRKPGSKMPRPAGVGDGPPPEGLYVDDAADGILLAAGAITARPVNLGSGNEISIRICIPSPA
jgi:nucleoside-diphosphate-sugar epimerase